MQGFNYIDLIGFIAGGFLAISALPQLLKIIIDHDTKSVSFYMVLLLMSGGALWLTYGVLTNALSMIVSNALSCSMYLVILIFKIVNIAKKQDKMDRLRDIFKLRGKKNEKKD